MKKPVYHHPPFVIETSDLRTDDKRYWLKLKISETEKENILVILKNPSRATKDISDKTIYTVTNYIFKNKNNYAALKNVGSITILNLIPYFETYSENLAKNKVIIYDKENINQIKEFCANAENIITAWGNAPSGLFADYEKIKLTVEKILKSNKNKVYFVDKYSNDGNPKHGQVWAYKDKLIQTEI